MTSTDYNNGRYYNIHEYLPELITSLLYASAISAMLSLSMSLLHSNISYISIINTFLIILVVFADWNNRILVPLQFPQKDLDEKRKPFFQYTKLVSEIISMVFLVMFYSYFIKENHDTKNIINIYLLFALYLFSCGLWNLIIIRIMKGVNICPLLFSIMKGDVFDLKDLKDYTKHFIEKFKNKEKELEAKFDDERARLGLNKSKKTHTKGTRRIMREVNAARTLAQFIGNHILWVNFWISFMLIVITFFPTFRSTFIGHIFTFFQFPISISILKLVLLVIAGSLLFILILCVDLDNVIRKTLFGLSMLLYLLIFYSCLSLDYLIYIMIIQQIFIGLAIPFISDGSIHSRNQTYEQH